MNNTPANKEKELVEKVNNLSADQKEEFKTVLTNEMPYTTLNNSLEIVSTQLPKEVVEILNKNPQLLVEMGIDITNSVQTVELESIQNASFKDVKANHWAYEMITKAAELGIVKGYPQGTFKPNSKLTLEDTFTFLDRVLLINDQTEMKLSRDVVEKYITDKDTTL